jgi:hypothetical protein
MNDEKLAESVITLAHEFIALQKTVAQLIDIIDNQQTMIDYLKKRIIRSCTDCDNEAVMDHILCEKCIYLKDHE